MTALEPRAPALVVNPLVCPLGCTMCEGYGSCPGARDPATRRFVTAYLGFICAPAHTVWDAAGRPRPSDDVMAAAARAMPLPTRSLPPTAARGVQLPLVLANAPASIDAWTVYAPHVQNRRGGFHDDKQRELIARARAIDAMWAKGSTIAVDAVPWLVLLGLPGTGKTYLCRILARRAAEAGLRVAYELFDPLVRTIKATRAPGAETRDVDVFRRLANVDLLILDDVRPLFGSQDDENIAHEIVAARYGEDRGEPRRPTFVAANLTVSELEGVVGSAALSRLLDAAGGVPVVCDWPSYRTARSDRRAP